MSEQPYMARGSLPGLREYAAFATRISRHAVPTDILCKERDDFKRWLETHPDAPPSTIAATNSVIEALEARIRDRKEDTNA